MNCSLSEVTISEALLITGTLQILQNQQSNSLVASAAVSLRQLTKPLHKQAGRRQHRIYVSGGLGWQKNNHDPLEESHLGKRVHMKCPS